MAPIRRLAASWYCIVFATCGAAACGSSGANRTDGAGAGGAGGAVADADGGPVTAESWIIDNTTSIHGVTPMLLGTPRVLSGPHGDALCFDGDDAVVLDTNPVQGLAAFTIEALVRVDSVTTTALSQPRYLHIETTEPSRLTLEARVTETEWHLDTFLLSGTQSRTLIDASKVHPVGQWAWTALSYENGQMRHFVDGVEDANGTVTIPAFGPGKMSLGVRQNLQYWFVGCIREVRVTPAALAASALQRP